MKKVHTHKVQVNAQLVDVDIKLDTDTGMFHASYDGEHLRANDIVGLKKQLDALVREKCAVVFVPFIEIDEMDGDEKTNFGYGHNSTYVSAKLSLVFRVLFLSEQTFTDKDYRKRQYRVEKDGTVEEMSRRATDLPVVWQAVLEQKKPRERDWVSKRYDDDAHRTNLVPFTSERWQALLDICEGVKKMITGLDKFLVQDGRKTAAALDSFQGPRLLSSMVEK